MDVIEDGEDGAIPSRHRQPGAYGLEEPVLFDLRARRPGRLDAGQPSGELGQEAGELAGGKPQTLGELVVGDEVHEPPQRLEEGLVGDGKVLVAAAEENDGTGGVGPAGDLGGETGLADPRLAEEPEHGDPVAGRVRDHLGPLQLGDPAHEGPGRLDPELEGKGEGERVLARFPDHLAGGERFREALKLEEPHGSKLVPAPTPGYHPHDVGAEDLVGFGGRLQPGCLDNRRPPKQSPSSQDTSPVEMPILIDSRARAPGRRL